jgi:hypothetical protein
MICVKCGKEAGELSPVMRKARERLGWPLVPPKVCPSCVLGLVLSWDEDGNDPSPSSGEGLTLAVVEAAENVVAQWRGDISRKPHIGRLRAALATWRARRAGPND